MALAQQLQSKTPPLVTNYHEVAFLFDFDGTLVPLFHDTQQLIKVPSTTKQRLLEIQRLTDYACAVISGRPIQQLSRLLAPFQPIFIGQHGAEWPHQQLVGQASLLHPELIKQKELLYVWLIECSRKWGIGVIEIKSLSLAFHYPLLSAAVSERLLGNIEEAFEHIRAQTPDYRLYRGKQTLELVPAKANKGKAILALESYAPFKNRQLIFIGDDNTDEDAFSVINAQEGISIKVGPGDSEAHYRLNDTEAVQTWLSACINESSKRQSPLLR